MTSVYVIEAQGGPVKIGIARDPKARLRDLGTGTPFPLRLAHVEDPGDLDAATVEKAAHALLKAARVHGEWFSVSANEARDAVRETIDRLRHPPAPVLPMPTSFPQQVGPISPAQSRAARALLDWGQAELAQRSNLSESTIRNFEKGRALPSVNNLAAIRRAFETAGAIVPDENGEGPGVRLRKMVQGGPGDEQGLA